MIRQLLLSVSLLTASSLALADFTSAMDDYDKGRFAQACTEFGPLADQGNNDAQYMYGLCHKEGDGVERDLVEAYKWFELAAKGGNDAARREKRRLGHRMDKADVDRAKALAQDWVPARARERDRERSARRIERIKLAQELLARLGYEPGPADGQPGKRTRDAVRQFRADHDMRDGDRISGRLLRKLEDVATRLPTDTGSKAELITELSSLRRKIREQRAADRWVGRALRDLLNKYDWPWKETVFSSEFTKRDGAEGWRTLSGSVETSRRTGLILEASEREPRRSRPRSAEEAIIGAIIGTDRVRRDRRPRIERARAGLGKSLPGTLLLSTRVRIFSADASTEIRLDSRERGSRGYALRLEPAAQGGLRLVRSQRGPDPELARAEQHVDIADDRLHRIDWYVKPRGRVEIQVDGKTVIRTRLDGLPGSFDGVTLTQRSGRAAVHDMHAYTTAK